MATLKDFLATPATQGTRSVMPGDQPLPQPTTIRDLLTYKDPKTWQKVLGIIGDGLQVAGGGRASFMPTLQAQRQHDADIQQEWNLAEMKGQQDIERFKAQKQYERDNPAPTEFQRNYQWLQTEHPDQAGDYLSRQTDNTVWRQGPDGRFYPYDPSASAAPAKPVGKLTPITAPEATPQTSQYTPTPDVVKQAYMDLYGEQMGAKMYDDLIGGR